MVNLSYFFISVTWYLWNEHLNILVSKRGYNFVEKITNVGFHGKPFIFFYFCDLVFMDYFFNFGWYSRKCWQKNLKLWWYSWNAKKKKWNHLVPGVGPRVFFASAAPKNSNNNPWIPGHKNKKIWVVYHEILHWWFWTKL